MQDAQYIRKVQTSVTVFLRHGDHYLLLRRKASKRIDPDRLNGIGGRVEPGEDFLRAAVRETEEETGYMLEVNAFRLAGIVRLEGGYDEDWVVSFFTAIVPDRSVPRGHQTEDGELLWLHKDKVLDSGYEVVDDLNYCFKDVVSRRHLFFMNAKVGTDQKIIQATISRTAVG